MSTKHIIVVDNHSTDTSLRDCQKRFPSCIYIRCTKNHGFARGANRGAREALDRGADTVTFCNPDAVLDPLCMTRLYKALHRHPDSIVTPHIYTDITRHKTWFCGGHIDFWRMRAVHTHPCNTTQPLGKNAFLSGCVLTVPQSVFARIGFFDERFFLYYEDVDFSLRAHNAGIALRIVPDAYAYHAEVSEDHKERKTYHLVLSGLRFFEKHAHNRVQKCYFALYFALRRLYNRIKGIHNNPLRTAVHRAYNDFEQTR
ncbi:MAG: hypothetical protein CR954_00770 [Candidatus Moraniibacteriota bacterium]|nr:MAG: hypothetical protein CR954_00770 [Candidatus Moranbacteria bacterium]